MKKRLSVAVFNTQPPHLYFGGVERRIVETAKSLGDNVDTRVYSGSKKSFTEAVIIDGTTFIPCFSTDVAFPVDNWVFNRSLSRLTGYIKADVYEAHTVSGYGFFEAASKQEPKKPLIQTIHGVLMDEFIKSSISMFPTLRSKLSRYIMWYLSQVEKRSAEKATLVVTVSEYSAKKIVQLYNIDEGKIRVVPNGVDVEKFKPTDTCEEFKQKISVEGQQVVLFVGRLVPRKGLHFLIEAAEEILRDYKETMFVLVGEGPMKAPLTSYSKRRGIQNHFLFIGDLPDSELPLIYNSADVFALPSLQEGQGMVLLEAQATATPVVAFNRGAVNEVVLEKETGFLVEPDSHEMADAISHLLTSEALRVKMGEKGRRFICSNFTWDMCAESMLKVYREAVELVESPRS